MVHFNKHILSHCFRNHPKTFGYRWLVQKCVNYFSLKLVSKLFLFFLFVQCKISGLNRCLKHCRKVHNIVLIVRIFSLFSRNLDFKWLKSQEREGIEWTTRQQNRISYYFNLNFISKLHTKVTNKYPDRNHKELGIVSAVCCVKRNMQCNLGEY